jgi:hypothetical protein
MAQAEPMIRDELANSGTDVATVAVLFVAVVGFIYTLISGRRTTTNNTAQQQADRITDLIRQRDEAKADLYACERLNRALERTILNLKNGHDP